MLYGLLLSIHIFSCIAIVSLVLIQQGKDSMGLGALGGGTQMLFGGSGGQNFFQKATWFFAVIFMGLSLGLALMKSSRLRSRYIGKAGQVAMQQDVQETPAPTEGDNQEK